MQKTNTMLIMIYLLLGTSILFGSEKQLKETGSAGIVLNRVSGLETLERDSLSIFKKAGNEVNSRIVDQKISALAKQNQIPLAADRPAYNWVNSGIDVEIPLTSAGLRWDDDGIIDAGTGNQKAISMARRENGDIYVAYEDYNFDQVKIHVKYSTDDGDTWQIGWAIGSTTYDAFFPDLTIGEGNQDKLIVSYYTSTGATKVYVRDLNSSEAVFHTLEGGGGNDNVRPQVTVDTDSYFYIYVCWIEEDLFQDDIYYSRSTNYGLTFSDPDFILDGIKQNVDIGWGNGNLYITYQDDDNPGTIKVIKSNSSYGIPEQGWSSPILASGSTSDYAYPRIAVSDHNDRAAVVFNYAYSSSDYDIYYAYTLDGINWFTNNSLETSTTMEWLADVYYMPYSSSGNNFHLAFNEDGQIKYRSSDNGTAWTGAEILSDDSNASNDDFVAACADDENQAMVAWVGGSSPNWNIYFDTDVACEVPSSPSGINATSNACDQITINWNTVTGADSYDIYRDGDPLYTDNLPPYLDNTSGTHSYFIIAVNDCGESNSSLSDTETAMSEPDPPTAVSASDGECGQVAINYTGVTGATNYKIYRDNEFLANDDTPPYVDQTTGSHSYYVRAENECGMSDNSNTDGGSALSPPSAPSGLSASGDECDQICLTWNAVAGATGYRIYKDGTFIAEDNNAPFCDNASGNHDYFVRAINDCGESSNSNTDNGQAGSVPAIPLNLIATNNECEQIMINWSTVSDVVNYQLFRDGSFLTEVSGTTHTDVINGAYNYSVKAENACGLSSNSNVADGLGLSQIMINNINYIKSIDGYTYTFSADASWLTGQDVIYAWEFGDGIGTSSQAQPVYTYSGNMSVSVTLHLAYAGIGNSVCDITHSTEILDVVSINSAEIPTEYVLKNAFPNPFNPFTNIRYALPDQSRVTLEIYDYSGKRVKTLVMGIEAAGWYESQWNGTNDSGNQVSSGMYFARLTTGNYSQTIKLVYLK